MKKLKNSNKMPFVKGATKMPSTKSKKDDGTFDLEQQFVLRMPPGPAMALRHDVDSGSMILKDKLYIEINNDMRHGCVRYGDKVFKTKLVDLPCVVETLKTTDSKTFYKSADISQMLVCVSEDESSDEEADANKKPKDKEKKYHWNHGITPPLKNARKKRFRKVLRKKHADQPEIEKEVKRLLRMDNEAIDVKWEVVVDEEKSAELGVQEQVLAHGELGMLEEMALSMNLNMKPGPSGDRPLEHDIFGEVSSSEDEDEKDINIMDSGEDENSKLMMGDESLMSSLKDDSVLGAELNEEAGELQERLTSLGAQIAGLRDQHLQLGMDVDMTDDPSMKAAMAERLEMVIKEETEKEKEYQILESMLNQ